MKWAALLVFALACATTAPPAPTPTARVDPLQARLQAVVRELSSPPFGSGASLTLFLGPRRLRALAGRERDGGPAVTTRTRFDVMSVSKALTAAKIVALAYDGRLRLNDPLALYLPHVSLVTADKRNHAPDVSVRGLLMHRAGLPHNIAGFGKHLQSIGSGWGDPEVFRKLTRRWTISLIKAPGDYSYANTDYALAAAIIERMGKCTFATCMRPLLDRLGMRTATFDATSMDKDAAHGRVARHNSVCFNAPAWYGSRYAAPYTGLWVTTDELARFGQHLVAARDNPKALLHAMTAPPAGGRGYGLGLVHRRRAGLASLEHDGGGPGFLAWLMVIPSRQLSLALATNGGIESKAQAKRLSKLVAALVASALAAPSASTAPSTPGPRATSGTS